MGKLELYGYLFQNLPIYILLEPLKEAQVLAKAIIDKNKPLFGICLGQGYIKLQFSNHRNNWGEN